MEIQINDSPREFTVGQNQDIVIRDCAHIQLEANEQVTFVTQDGREYDVVRKSWGFYATPSLNGRLKNFDLRAALVRNSLGKLYVMLIEKGKESAFQNYLVTENIQIVAWLDTDEAVSELARALDLDAFPKQYGDSVYQERQNSLAGLLQGSKGRSSSQADIIERLINHFPIRSSRIFSHLLRLAGVEVGKNVQFLGMIRLKIRGKPENIIIGDNVTIGNNVDLRNRENGRIILNERVYLDDNVRLVAAREGKIEIDYGSELGNNTIINSGGITEIGKFCMFAGHVNINSSSHQTLANEYIKAQSHRHGVIKIGDDVWLGANVAVLADTTIGEGAVIGANAVVTNDIPAFAICVGAPARVIRYRLV